MEFLPWTERVRVEPLLAASTHAEGLPGWFAALAETTLATGETAVFARHGDAVLPGALGPRGFRALTAPYTTQYVPALPDRAAAAALGRQLRAAVLHLDGLDGADPAIASLLQGLGERYAVATYRGFVNWSTPIGDFDTYWRARPSRLRATVRRKGAAGRAAFWWFRNDFSIALAQYEAIRAASWKEPEPHPDFLAALIRHMAPHIRMGLLEIGGKMAAAQIWLVHGGRATIFKLVHREDAAALSPGTQLTRCMIECCLREDAVSAIDFGRGDDPYKRDWMSERTSRMGVIAADWRSGSGLRTIAREIVPTWAGGAWRRHFGGNRAVSAAVSGEQVLAAVRAGRTVPIEAVP